MKTSTRLAFVSFGLVAVTIFVLMGILIIEEHRLGPRLESMVRQQATAESRKLVEMVQNSCASAEAQAQTQLQHSLEVARDFLQARGPISLGGDKVSWEAENQLTHQKLTVELPKLVTGSNWLGQNFSATTPSPVVDDTKHFTRADATVFQRMNEAGDMLRVCTSVLRADGSRAVGTFIPALNPDGQPNAVVAAALKGQTYRGRACVVNAWHDATYEPVWDASHQRVIGMLFVGVNMAEATRTVREGVLKIHVGKTGYMYVLTGKGENRGHYVISKNGERDGENIWETKDPNGRLVVQDIVQTATTSTNSAPSILEYQWENPGDSLPRVKFAAVAYFAPWDWVLGLGAYYDELTEAQAAALGTLTQLLWWTGGAAAILAVLALAGSILLSRSITRPS